MSDSFWDFSLRTYKLEGVPEACLKLQNKLGVDVNMFLFCCWHGLNFGRIEDTDFSQILDKSERWAEQVVRPLRGARSWMKVDALEELALPADELMALREKIKSNELGAEKIQQTLLESVVSGSGKRELSKEDQLRSMLGNIHQYFKQAKIAPEASDLHELGHIIESADANFSRADVDAAIAREF